jgi:hypothetical protein
MQFGTDAQSAPNSAAIALLTSTDIESISPLAIAADMLEFRLVNEDKRREDPASKGES